MLHGCVLAFVMEMTDNTPPGNIGNLLKDKNRLFEMLNGAHLCQMDPFCLCNLSRLRKTLQSPQQPIPHVTVVLLEDSSVFWLIESR